MSVHEQDSDKPILPKRLTPFKPRDLGKVTMYDFADASTMQLGPNGEVLRVKSKSGYGPDLVAGSNGGLFYRGGYVELIQPLYSKPVSWWNPGALWRRFKWWLRIET